MRPIASTVSLAMARKLVVIGLVALAGGCIGSTSAHDSDGRVPRAPSLARAPVELRQTPRWIAELCATNALLRPGCPAVVPRGVPSTSVYLETFPDRPATLSIESGGQYYGRPRRNRPPRYVHVTVAAKRLTAVGAARWARPVLPAARPGDAVRSDTGRAELVSRPTWFGVSGAVVLTGGHDVAFRWRTGETGFQIGLHAWAPFRETVPTLRVIVGRTLAARRGAAARAQTVGGMGGMRWIAMPAWVTDACASLPRLGALCPRVIPLARSDYVGAVAVRSANTCGSGSRDLLSVQWSAEDPSHPRHNRPPRFLHFEASAGAGCLRWQYARAPVTPHPGMMRGREYEGSSPVPLGTRTWGGHRGLLVLGDCFGNHLCFRWRAGGGADQLDLHGWEPFPETVGALRRMVSSLGG